MTLSYYVMIVYLVLFFLFFFFSFFLLLSFYFHFYSPISFTYTLQILFDLVLHLLLYHVLILLSLLYYYIIIYIIICLYYHLSRFHSFFRLDIYENTFRFCFLFFQNHYFLRAHVLNFT